MKCKHLEYKDGHCAEMECKGYVNKCPKHGIDGNEQARCSLVRVKK